MVEGLLSALTTRDGRYVGFIDISDEDENHPSDEACAVVGYVAPSLANVVDPLQSARWFASTLSPDCAAVGLVGDGLVITLHGVPEPDVLDPSAAMHRTAASLLGGSLSTVGFLAPRAAGGWYGCRAYRCRDEIVVVTARELSRPHELTRRELEVLALLVDGCSNAQIAQTLWVTTRTVKAHVEHILEKLEVPTRAAAVGRANKEGLLLPSDAG
jgi:DNA-binding CsgD family transcriptional regulator